VRVRPFHPRNADSRLLGRDIVDSFPNPGDQDQKPPEKRGNLTGSVARRPSPRCAGRLRCRHPRAKSPAPGSPAATGQPTTLYTASRWCMSPHPQTRGHVQRDPATTQTSHRPRNIQPADSTRPDRRLPRPAGCPISQNSPWPPSRGISACHLSPSRDSNADTNATTPSPTTTVNGSPQLDFLLTAIGASPGRQVSDTTANKVGLTWTAFRTAKRLSAITEHCRTSADAPRLPCKRAVVSSTLKAASTKAQLRAIFHGPERDPDCGLGVNPVSCRHGGQRNSDFGLRGLEKPIREPPSIRRPARRDEIAGQTPRCAGFHPSSFLSSTSAAIPFHIDR